jgi:amino acid adenylation domain-containing protein
VVAGSGAHPLHVPRPGAAGPPPDVAPEVPPEVTVLPDNLAAVYYTSGSTGRPKGVACTHAGWVNRMNWMSRHHPLRPGETVLHKTTLTFDDAAVEIFWPLLSGGRVALLEPGLHRDPRAIAEAAIRYRAVHVQFVPSVLELFLDTLTEMDSAELAGLTELRSVLSSGEALRPVLVRRFAELFGDRVILDNTWGATEVSIDSTCRVCVPEDALADGGAVCVGVPIDNNEVLVLDRFLDRLPVGVPGELYIGGVGLARGYLGDPRRTAESFVPHPERPGERLYRTGDWGRLRPDRSLTFLNRRDDQVKVRGVRIELGEVEHALRTHPAVSDAAVIAWEAAPGDKRLAAYAVAAGCSAEDLVEHARAVLPGYAVPGSLALVDTMPRHSNGKLNRRALPVPDPTGARGERDYLAPRTPAEQALARIWASVLGLDRIGAHDDFFAMGGHSLLATRAIGRMRQAFAIDIPLSVIFECPTVARSAEMIEQILLTEIESLSDEEAERLLG